MHGLAGRLLGNGADQRGHSGGQLYLAGGTDVRTKPSPAGGSLRPQSHGTGRRLSAGRIFLWRHLEQRESCRLSVRRRGLGGTRRDGAGGRLSALSRGQLSGIPARWRTGHPPGLCRGPRLGRKSGSNLLARPQRRRLQRGDAGARSTLAGRMATIAEPPGRVGVWLARTTFCPSSIQRPGRCFTTRIRQAIHSQSIT